MFTHLNIPLQEDLEVKTINGLRCYLAPNGESYASVTTILGDAPKPWLESWKQSMGTKKAVKETERCSIRGTALHQICEDYLNNVENPTKNHDALPIKLFNKIKIALSKHINNIHAQEVALWSDRLRTAGRVDLIAEMDKTLSIIDFKTSNNNKKKEDILDYFLQCTIYALCWYEMTGQLIEDIVIIIAVEKGLMPQVFKEKIYKYIIPAKQRIDDFYKKHEHSTKK